MSKMLTLTYGGKEKRAESNPHDAYDEMSQAFHKLLRAMQKKHGKIFYLRVVEQHKDGWPHFHVLLVGNGIGHVGIKAEIEKLWRGKYGLGFIKINQVKNQTHAIRYITKYLTKDLEPVAYRKRVFTASKGALLPVYKPTWYYKEFKMGLVDKGLKENPRVREVDLDKTLNIPKIVMEALSPRLYHSLIGDVENIEADKLFNEILKGGSNADA